MLRVCESCEPVSEQELQRTVEADVGQSGCARSPRLACRWAEAQKAIVALVRGGETGKAIEQRGRILRQVAGKRRDLGFAIEAVAAERLARKWLAGDGVGFCPPAGAHGLA